MFRYFFIIKLVEDTSYEVERSYVERYICEETISRIEFRARQKDMVTTYDMDKFILTVAFVGEGY